MKDISLKEIVRKTWYSFYRPEMGKGSKGIKEHLQSPCPLGVRQGLMNLYHINKDLN